MWPLVDEHGPWSFAENIPSGLHTEGLQPLLVNVNWHCVPFGRQKHRSQKHSFSHSSHGLKKGNQWCWRDVSEVKGISDSSRGP